MPTSRAACRDSKITPYDTPAIFPSGQAGAAAVIRKMLESPLYANKTMWDLIGKWVSHGTPGGYAPWIEQQTGIPVNTRITREFLMSDDGLKFLKAMARYETKSSEEYPLTDEQWRAARDAGARIKRGQQNPPANPQSSRRIRKSRRPIRSPTRPAPRGWCLRLPENSARTIAMFTAPAGAAVARIPALDWRAENGTRGRGND